MEYTREDYEGYLNAVAFRDIDGGERSRCVADGTEAFCADARRILQKVQAP